MIYTPDQFLFHPPFDSTVVQKILDRKSVV